MNKSMEAEVNAKCVTVAIAGYGLRGQGYATYAEKYPERMKIVAVAEPILERREAAVKRYNIAAENTFHTAEEMLTNKKLADVMIIATQDRQHVPMAIPALALGYDLLVEKPISPELSECMKLLEATKQSGRSVTVCHVLRYTEFFGTIKRLLNEGRIGKLINIKLLERVGYWHQAHSFVRGNWSSSKETSPMILAKSCHDMDLISFLAGETCTHVSSFGGLGYFHSGAAPEGAAKRCLSGCKVKEACPYDAEKIYLDSERTGVRHGKTGWPLAALVQEVSEGAVVKALQEGPYGRCVFHCDNDVVDHQVVNMQFESGLTSSFTMTAFTSGGGRQIQLQGTLGDIEADMEDNIVRVTRFGEKTEEIDIQKIAESLVGHGGGDERLIHSFISRMLGEDDASGNLTSIDASIQSHVMALAAEHSRTHQGESIDLKHFCK